MSEDVARRRMVEDDLRRRGVRDERVLAAMLAVDRVAFLPDSEKRYAYDDRALPIGEGQTISQPLMVALMLEALELQADDTVLEVGAGSGYAAAVASRLCKRVVALERIPTLAASARERLAHLGFGNVTVVAGDGSTGWPSDGPYDGILVSAAAPAIPPQLVAQLADRGRLVVPVGGRASGQQLRRVRKRGEQLEDEDLGAVAFVPLIGEAGWSR